MLFVALLNTLPGKLDEVVTRRLENPTLKGAEIIAEYWLQTPKPTVIVVLEADHISQLWAVFWDWNDIFEISIYPATGAKEGLTYLKKMAE